MKTIKLNFSLLIMTLFFFGCKKEHAPASTIGTPEFYFNGTVAGTATSLNAGVNNYYMYSSYTQDTNNVYNFIGDLKQTTSGTNSVQILINDYKASVLNGSTNIDSSLIVGNYPYYVPGAVTNTSYTVYQVQFNSSYANGTAQTYYWNFGDGSNSTMANPIHTYTALGYYDVCLNITGTNSCSNSICDTVNLSSPTAYACHTVITSTVVPGTTTVTFSNTATGTAPYTYFWNFGDSTTYTSSSSDTVRHNYVNPGTYAVSLRVTDANNKTTYAKYNVTTATAPITCITNFNISTIQAVPTSTPNIVSNPFGLGDVTVIWTDAAGNVYTSKNNAQPASSNFQIISVDNYPNNANNQRTKKLHVKFNCLVYNSTHPPVQITNADAVITVAYK